MMDIPLTPVARLVVWLGCLTILSAVAVYVMRRFRGGIEETETSSSLLTKFRDSRHRGELSEAEFRTIKTILAERMQAELNQEDDSG